MDGHERCPSRETGIGPAHGNPHGRGFLGNGHLNKLYPLDKNHQNDASHKEMDEALEKSSPLSGQHLVEDVESEVTSFLKAKGGSENREPDKKISRQFFGPIKGLGQEIAIDHLKKDDDGHDRNESDENCSLSFGEEIVEPG